MNQLINGPMEPQNNAYNTGNTEAPVMPTPDFTGTPGQGGRYKKSFKKAMGQFIVNSDMTLEEIAVKTGISRGSLARWARHHGKRRNVTAAPIAGTYTFTANNNPFSTFPFDLSKGKQFENRVLFPNDVKQQIGDWLLANPKISLTDASRMTGISDSSLSRWKCEATWRRNAGVKSTIQATVTNPTPIPNQVTPIVASKDQLKAKIQHLLLELSSCISQL